MATYSIKAPDGNTYDIDGPDGATDEQVRLRVLAAHPNAAKPSAARVAQDAEDAKIRAQGGSDGNAVMDTVAGVGKAMSDMWLGGKQLAASVGMGDKEALAKEAADKEELDASLMRTGGGMVGKYGTDIAASFLPMGIATKAIKGAGMIPGMARAAAAGGAQELLNPDKNYDPIKQAGKGAAFGAGGDVVGRVAGRAYAPFRNKGAGATSVENAALLNAEGLPHQIPATQTDSPMVQAMTNALEQIPIVGHGVRKARSGNLGWLTEKATAPTGKAVEELTPSARREMYARLNNEGNAFRTQDQIAMTPVAAEAQQAANNVRQYAQATNQTGDVSRLENVAKALGDVSPGPMRPPLPAGIPPPPTGIGMPGPQRAKIPQVRTADEVMDLRNAASELAHKETDPILKAQYQKYRESLADELRHVHGTNRFDDWLKQWGAMEDVQRAAGKGGRELTGGKLSGERLSMNLDDSFRPGSKLDDIVSAAAENMPTPPRGWNRAMIQSAMLGGAPMALGVGADYLKGDVGWGTGLGTGVSASLISGLSRKVPPQQRIDALRQLLTAVGIGTGQQF